MTGTILKLSTTAAFLLLASGCGRIGYEIYHDADVDMDASVDSGIDASAPLDADLDAALDAPLDADVDATLLDLGTPDILVSPLSGLLTSEAGTDATFSIVLATAPTSDVTIALESGAVAEATISLSSVTFTPLDWFTPRAVTVTGVDDFVVDGGHGFTIVTSNAVSEDPTYNDFIVPDVNGVNLDDDVPGIVVVPTTGLVTNEGGASTTFTMVLSSLPVADVTISLSSTAMQEGTVFPSFLTFTSTDALTPQLVTVTGVDDAIADGNVDFTIVTAPSTSADPVYDSIDAADVSVTNVDDDTASVAVVLSTGLVTNESGGTADFTIALGAQPTGIVTISLASSDASEGTLAVAEVIFDGSNWDIPQVVTITGVDDAVDDGDIAFTIVTGAALSSDASYNGIAVVDVSVTNADNDMVGANVSPTSALTTTENGAAAMFTIVLGSQPTADVSIGLTSSDLTEGTVAPATLFFTNANWNVPQSVTVTGVDDLIVDGAVGFSVVTGAAASTDPLYAGLGLPDVGVSNLDNDFATIVTTPTRVLSTTESGGTDSFSVVLTSQPSASVTIGLSSSTPSAGSVAPLSIAFTTMNWNVPQTATVTGMNDAIVGVNVVYNILTSPAVSADPLYNGLVAGDVRVVNFDDDAPYATEAYAKPSVARAFSQYGQSMSISGDGNTMAVGAVRDEFSSAGTVYLFTRSGRNWTQQALLRASNSRNASFFGNSVSLSNDGNTLAVGASSESSDATGVNGDQSDTSVMNAGAVYVFTRAGATWTQQAYIKASNTGTDDQFGLKLTLSADGNTLAVSAPTESSNATGIDGNQNDNSQSQSGAVYVFFRAGSVWSQQAYVKALDADANDWFGVSLSLSGDGNILAVGAYNEGSNAVGIGGDFTNDSAPGSGAAYVLIRTGSTWSHHSYIKSSNSEMGDNFGVCVSLSADGNTLAVGANGEDSNATGVGGNQANNASATSGAVYIFARSAGVWAQQQYIKASNAATSDMFGFEVALSANGNRLLATAWLEDSNAVGVNGDQSNNAALEAGAAYAFARSGVVWTQTAYLKPSNTTANERFGTGSGISANGVLMGVAAGGDDSTASGVNRDGSDTGATNSGAVYVFFEN